MVFFLKRTILIFGMIFLCFRLPAQHVNTAVFSSAEDSLRVMFNAMQHSYDDQFKLSANQKIDSIFSKILRLPGSFNYPFDSLTMIGHLYAPDHSFRFINWNLALSDGSYKYFAYLQTYDKKKDTFRVFRLQDKRDEVNLPENSVLSAEKWYGALYYQILKEKVDFRTYYTLLALQYENSILSRKIIEVLYFDRYHNPVFGAPIFKDGNQIKLRIVFQYSAQTVMVLHYVPKLKMIVFDHLSPSKSQYQGEYEFYGPDMSFDGFKFKKGHWVLHSDLDLRDRSRSRSRR